MCSDRNSKAVLFEYMRISMHSSGPVAQWIRHRPMEPGIAGSSPAGVIILGRKQHFCTEYPKWCARNLSLDEHGLELHKV